MNNWFNQMLSHDAVIYLLKLALRPANKNNSGAGACKRHGNSSPDTITSTCDQNDSVG
jgi:hypothetical protein